MSLKSIEMQIALPRTQDAGKIQEQLQARGQLEQDYANGNRQKEDMKKRTTVMKQEQKASPRFQKEKNDKEHQQNQEHQKREKNSVKQKQEHHPYKGKHFDFSG